jgi:hypothetical protein
VQIFVFGVPPEWRLPLRAYHSALFFKKGVPIGYVEVLSLFERAELGFNLYYTFREGEYYIHAIRRATHGARRYRESRRQISRAGRLQKDRGR